MTSRLSLHHCLSPSAHSQTDFVFGNAPDLTEEELRQRGDAAEALFREIVRKAKGKPG
jgi:hypothetical protein